jgi:hypothetical protein
MLTKLSDAMNKIGTAFVERMENKDKRKANSPGCLEYQPNLAKTKAMAFSS